MKSIYEPELLAAARLETAHLLGEIDGLQGAWIVTAEGTQVAHSGRAGAGAPVSLSICASMTLLAGILAANSNTGTPRSLVLETSTSRWIIQSLTVPGHRWIAILLTDRMSLLAWVLSRISLCNHRLGLSAVSKPG